MLADNSYSNLDVARNSMCSNFKWIKRAWDLTDVDSKDLEGYSVSNINGSFYIKILKSKLTTPDVNGFKAWLKDNPTEIIYQLATPVVEVIVNCLTFLLILTCPLFSSKISKTPIGKLLNGSLIKISFLSSL